MEGMVTMSLTDYVELMDSVKELQSQVEKYAEQIQKDQLENSYLREFAISKMVTISCMANKYEMREERRDYLNSAFKITNKEIDAYLAKVNS